MSAIAGFCDFTGDLTQCSGESTHILNSMSETMARRGGAVNGVWLDQCCGLSGSSKKHHKEPPLCTQVAASGACAVVFDGEVYNRAALKTEFTEETCLSDAALVLAGFLRYGSDIVNRLNGVFAFAVWHDGALHLIRDHAGVKPLFYTQAGGRFVFASEMKALFAHPGIEARLDRQGLAELFVLGPAREESSGVFKDIYALPPGCVLTVRPDASGTRIPITQLKRYWDISFKPHTDSEAETATHVRALLEDAITRQTDTDDNVCSFLSGGVDSSVVTAVAARILSREGKTLRTFSFDFTGSDSHFTANTYQPERDRPWVDAMKTHCQTRHSYVECGPDELAGLLGDAVTARDLPGMADIDASLLYFCAQLPEGTVALTGECADEVFGGYPWFIRTPEPGSFPWSSDLNARKTLLSEALLSEIDFNDSFARLYRNAFERAVKAVGGSESGDAECVAAGFTTSANAPYTDANETHLRIVSYLTVKYFMSTLTERMDRMGATINARVPFADKPLMDYVWSIPWAIKNKNGTAKYILREAMRGWVPDEVLFRKKSPFPKTYDPVYMALVAERVTEDIINNPNAPVRDWIDLDQVNSFINAPAQTAKPWFGQLMAGPQRLAYIWQVNYWLQKYKVQIEW